MLDWITDRPIIFFGGLILLAVGVMVLYVKAEEAELQSFRQRCLDIPKSEAECELLISIKRSADAAQFSAGIAAGAAVGSIGSRR